MLKTYLLLAAGIGVVSSAMIVTNASQAAAQMKPLVVEVLSSALAPLFVRNVNEPADEPFQTELCFPPGSDFCQSHDVTSGFTVPTTTDSGQTVRRMVVEYVSGTCFGGLQYFEAQVHSVVNGGAGVRHHVVPVPGEPGWLNIAQQLRIYADPGSTVRISGTTNGLGACELAVSGHLVAH